MQLKVLSSLSQHVMVEAEMGSTELTWLRGAVLGFYCLHFVALLTVIQRKTSPLFTATLNLTLPMPPKSELIKWGRKKMINETAGLYLCELCVTFEKPYSNLDFNS